MSDQRSEDDLHRRLMAWAAADPAERIRLSDEVRRIYEEDLAILVLDMSGFSATVLRQGIMPFLAKLHGMRELALPAVARNGGELVKFIADDVLAAFPTVDQALAAAREIVIDSRTNPHRAPDMRFGVSIGIGWGPTLHVPGADLWGDDVNQTFKLGEDTGNAGEILLTRAAYDRVSGDRSHFERMEIRISGLELEAFVTRPGGA